MRTVCASRPLVIFILFVLICLSPSIPSAEKPAGPEIAEPEISIEFNSLDDLEPVLFKKISRHTSYSIEVKDGERFLQAITNASASGLVVTEAFNVYEMPLLSWQWRVTNILDKGHAGKKEGDDFPARVYVMFDHTEDSAPMGYRFKQATLKAIFGKAPPHSTLNYIWANRKHEERYITSPYTNWVRMVVLEEGMPSAPEVWVHEMVNIIEDYRAAFGNEPPPMARVAVMSDADNTGGRVTAYFDSIRVSSAIKNSIKEDTTR